MKWKAINVTETETIRSVAGLSQAQITKARKAGAVSFHYSLWAGEGRPRFENEEGKIVYAVENQRLVKPRAV